jgi:hypothetical protein
MLAHAQTGPALAQRVALDSPDGQRLLLESSAHEDFFRLAEQFVTQERPAYCGVASAVMVLNALGTPAPDPPAFGDYRAFTQENLFNARARHVAPAEAVQRSGMTLDQFAGIVQSHPARARALHADQTTVDEFRRLASENLAQPGNYVVVNYDRAGVGQEPSAHFSPLGAYDARTDRFLVMDVARYKHPPVWVRAGELFGAMDTRDPIADASRGFVLIDAAPSATSPPGPPARNRVARFLARVVAAAFGVGVVLGALGAWWITRRRWKRRLAAR